MARPEGATPPVALRSIVERHRAAHSTVGDAVYQIIRDAIVTGAVKQGEWLRQDELAETIGVSRIPVRSALMQLDAEGLITFHPYRGALVTEVTVADVREIYELRAVIESHALRGAMTAMTPERLQHLEELAHELNEIEDGETFLARRIDFFTELYGGGDQPLTLALIERLRLRAGRYSLDQAIGYLSPPGERDHLEILKYVGQGDVDGATRWLKGHLEELGRRLIELMERERLEPAIEGSTTASAD